MYLKKYFCNLNQKDLLIVESSIKNIIHKFCKYNYIEENFFLEYLNQNQNILISFVLLLFPFYDKTVNNIKSLQDLYYNSLYTNKFSEISNDIDIYSIIKYNEEALIRTIKICSNKFLVNSLEIIPIYINEYKQTQLYIDTLYKFKNNDFNADIGLSNDDIFNTIFNDLYLNVVKIEWKLENNFSSALEYGIKYFPHYSLQNNFKQENYQFYLQEVQNIYEHSWYSKNNEEKIKNIDLFKFAKSFTLSNKKKIWFSFTEEEKQSYIQKLISFKDKPDNLIDIIFESLIIKGCLSKFSLTENKNLPETFFFLTGKKHPVIKNTFYTMNWLSQINFFYHYIHHRIIFLTGGTGVGKSTQAPILLMYTDLMIYYDLYSQIICSVPRKNAVENNATRMNSQLLLKKDVDYNIQFQHSEANYLYPYPFSKINLKIVTDEILKNILKKNLFCVSKGNVTLNHILIDESHEHKINMDFILTILKHSLFLYNKHTKLFIISATMDEDDLNYRNFFKNILDKDIFFSNKHPYPEYLDRRLHITEYKKTNNFTIQEFYNNKIILNYKNAEKEAIEIIKKISFNTNKGTILGFSIGIREIESMIQQLNQIIPSNVIAVPLYSKYSISYRNAVSSPQFLDEWIYDKSYILEILNKYPDKWNSLTLSYPKAKYNRYIIIGTNIVEASLTISSLKYVVDTGYEKVAIYDYNKQKLVLHTKPISESSRIQRKGRVGRVSDGYVYYTYTKDERKNNKIQKEIQNQDISSYLFDIIGFQKIYIKEIDNSVEDSQKEIFIDGFDIKTISQNDFFIIKPTLNVQTFYEQQKKHFLWKSLFNRSFYEKIQDLKLHFLSKYLNNYEAIIILNAFYLYQGNENDFIRFLQKYIIEEQFVFKKINIVQSKNYIEKDTNFSVNLLLNFLQKHTTFSYYTQINKNNIHTFIQN